MARVSSNSSDRSRSLLALLDESFTILQREVPEAHRRICSELAGQVVAIRADHESVVVKCGGAAVQVRSGRVRRAACADIRTTRQAILGVIDGRVTLAEAVLAGTVSATAPLDALVQLNRGLALYVHGAVRAPSFPALLERFRLGPPARR